MTRNWCLFSFFFLFFFVSCKTEDPKEARYARKQFYLGNDYFDKYVESLQKIERLQIETIRTETEIAESLQQSPDEQTLMDIRLKKARIQKNLEMIRDEGELSKRYLNSALDELKKSLVADPGYGSTHFLLGLIYLKKATSDLDISTRMQCFTGESLQEHKDQADQLLKMARQHFVKASSDKQLASRAQNNIAVIDIHFSNHDGAISATRMALKDLVYQEGHVARSNMGWAYFHQKKYDLAISQLTQALLMEGKFCVARYRLGRVYLEQERLDDAIAEFEKTIRQGHPCNSIQELYLYLGLGYVKQHRQEEALQQFEICTRIAPNSCVAEECRQYMQTLRNDGDQDN